MHFKKLFLVSFLFLGGANFCFAQQMFIKKNTSVKEIIFGNGNIRAKLQYGKKAVITQLTVNNVDVISDPKGIYTSWQTAGATQSSLELESEPKLFVSKNEIVLSGINYGKISSRVSETWTFSTENEKLIWDIRRTTQTSQEVVSGSPVFLFKDMTLWEGAYQDFGGLAWFYLFNKPLDTYGVNSSSARFWNSKTGNGLLVSADAPNQQVAMAYTRTQDNKLSYSISVGDFMLKPKHDAGTQRRLFLRDRTDIWDSQPLKAGTRQQRITLSSFDTQKAFDRGDMKGIDAGQVANVLNTIARIGVINKKHFGANSWHTPYGPICLHEQYIAQMGIGINDESYLNGYQESLDYYRDNAIKSDGRVWSRWAYTNEDMMPDQVNDKGFYEAQWGFLMDSNTDLVTNVAELYQQTGNLKWVSQHKLSCEKALKWLLVRDENKNGLVEMFPNDQQEQKSSDWIDIIWASYENAFVNAKLYKALTLWAEIERQLGDDKKSDYYTEAASRLASSFNKNVADGGLWDPEKKCYVHWRDKGGAGHGSNMVTPVNFMAISYGICRDDNRKKMILDAIEDQMIKENLFFWPLTLTSYAPGEGKDWQFPFPNYENGDIFLSWGSTAVNAYANYKPEIAVKYIRKVLDQYGKDGLAFQRYGRNSQAGLGDDILAGNALSVVGLYQSVYGINPLYNRFYLNPHLTPELYGTVLKYHFRGQLLKIELNENRYAVSNERFRVSAADDFGFIATNNELRFFSGNSEKANLVLAATGSDIISLDIEKWGSDLFSWQQKNTPKVEFQCTITGCRPETGYEIKADGKVIAVKDADKNGQLKFSYSSGSDQTHFVVRAQ